MKLIGESTVLDTSLEGSHPRDGRKALDKKVKTLLVGDKSELAIESSMPQPLARLSQRGIGYFNIWVAGRRFGVDKPDATLLAASFDEVKQRIADRGDHCVIFENEDGRAIAEAYLSSAFEETAESNIFFGYPSADFRTLIYRSKIIWAPDGDEAFDDGSHVLQIDLEDFVRVIAFRRSNTDVKDLHDFTDIRVESEKFYEVLKAWRDKFETDWATIFSIAPRKP